jgi:hypothetical protein
LASRSTRWCQCNGWKRLVIKGWRCSKKKKTLRRRLLQIAVNPNSFSTHPQTTGRTHPPPSSDPRERGNENAAPRRRRFHQPQGPRHGAGIFYSSEHAPFRSQIRACAIRVSGCLRDLAVGYCATRLAREGRALRDPVHPAG